MRGSAVTSPHPHSLQVVAITLRHHHMHDMAQPRDTAETQVRRANLLARKIKHGEEGREAMADYVSHQAATLKRTETLRAQRLAREAEPRPIAVLPTKPKGARKKKSV